MLVRSIIILNILGALALVVWHPSLTQLIDLLSSIVPAVLALSFVASGVVLVSSYSRTTIAAVRRQIRLIAFVSFLTAACWIALRTLPMLLGQDMAIPDYWLDLLAGLLPLAYLVGAMAPDLYRTDRVLQWLSRHVCVALLLMAGIGSIAGLLGAGGPLAIVWMVVGGLALYQPVHYFVSSFVPQWTWATDSYRPLADATKQLVITLDRHQLSQAVCAGISQTFGHPPIGLYLQPVEHTGELVRGYQQRLMLPVQLPADPLTKHLQQSSMIIETKTAYQQLAGQGLGDTIDELLHHPGIALWCLLRHPNGTLLGLLVLGMRDDLDPYRAADMQALLAFLQTAALALSNSNAYMEQVESESHIRQLYQHMQHIRDETAAELAREIHDEVINVMVRANIDALQDLLMHVTAPELRTELTFLLEGEEATTETLRQICERLNPTGIAEPMGLTNVLRSQVEFAQTTLSGSYEYVVEGRVHPVSAPTQREAIRILREALVNAEKHAHGSHVLIHLRYPDQPTEPAMLIIRDTGKRFAMVRPRVGTWGVRNMIESARTVGGQLAFYSTPIGGVEVSFSFPVGLEEQDRDIAQEAAISTGYVAAISTTA